jgi:cytoskeleton protein RodZ
MSDENLGLDMGNERQSSGQPRPTDSSPSPAHIDSPGKTLAARRQELNWSVEDVAHSLHLAPRQIHAIEADNYDALPGVAITRGFIRSYAKLLKLDASPLVERITHDSLDSRAEDAFLRKALPAKPFYAHRSLSLGGKPRSRVWIAVCVVLIFLAAALFVAWKSDHLPRGWIESTKSLFPAQTEAGAAGEPKSNTEATQIAPLSMVTDVDRAHGLPDMAARNASAQPALQAANLQGAASLEGVSARDAGTPEQKEMLVLKLREDSWIEIRNARNKVLISRLAKAGESEAVPVTEPLNLIIGNAGGVDAQLRGVPVELNASAKSNVARLTVN